VHDLTLIPSLLGGLLIGLSASLLLVLSGKVAGISGIFATAVLGRAPDRAWRWWFLAGLVAGGILLSVLRVGAIGPSIRPLPVVLVAGVLVGFGTRLGGGCTSGHGVCGLSRLSKRSLVATLTFMACGAITVLLTRAWLGAQP